MPVCWTTRSIAHTVHSSNTDSQSPYLCAPARCRPVSGATELRSCRCLRCVLWRVFTDGEQDAALHIFAPCIPRDSLQLRRACSAARKRNEHPARRLCTTSHRSTLFMLDWTQFLPMHVTHHTCWHAVSIAAAYSMRAAPAAAKGIFESGCGMLGP